MTMPVAPASIARFRGASLIPTSLRTTIETSVNGVVADIVATTNTKRDDRLWPSDLMVYQTNPLNLAYGACGTALFLRQVCGSIPADAEAWILRQHLSTSTYPPGLYVGLTGIARALALLGHMEEAEDAIRLAYRSPLLFEDTGVLYGVAGWGMASLTMYTDTSNTMYLDYAAIAAEHLLHAAVSGKDGRHWPSSTQNDVQLGYAYGTAGIACFLIRMHAFTGDARFRSAALEAMHFTLRHAYRKGHALQWFSHIGGKTLLPYWRQGTAGVGIALLRFYQASHDDEYLAAARQAVDGVQMLFSALPGQFDGMSGVGDFLLDMYAITGDEQYYYNALELATSILCFEVATEGGLSFPGRALARLSADYAYGSAGTAAFLQRTLEPNSRSLDSQLYEGS